MNKANGGIWEPGDTASDVSDKLDDMHARARYHGYGEDSKGLYIVGMGTGDYDDCGFDAVTEYNYGKWKEDTHYAEMVTEVTGTGGDWETSDGLNTDAKFIPCVTTNVLDSIWMHGGCYHTGMDRLNTLESYSGYDAPDGMDSNSATPANFRYMMDKARDYINDHPASTERVVMINAWNEWGEGNVIEPSQQYGWGYLQNLRDIMGYNLLSNHGFEDGSSPWSFWCPGSGPSMPSTISPSRSGPA